MLWRDLTEDEQHEAIMVELALCPSVLPAGWANRVRRGIQTGKLFAATFWLRDCGCFYGFGALSGDDRALAARVYAGEVAHQLGDTMRSLEAMNPLEHFLLEQSDYGLTLDNPQIRWLYDQLAPSMEEAHAR